MARVDAFTGLSELLAVARHQSFRAAAAETKPGLFLYFPARSQDQPKLRALIEVTTRRLRPR